MLRTRSSPLESELVEISKCFPSTQVVPNNLDWILLNSWKTPIENSQVNLQENSIVILLWPLKKLNNLLMIISCSEEKIKCKLLLGIMNIGPMEEEFSSIIARLLLIGSMKEIISDLSVWKKDLMSKESSPDFLKEFL